MCWPNWLAAASRLCDGFAPQLASCLAFSEAFVESAFGGSRGVSCDRAARAGAVGVWRQRLSPCLRSVRGCGAPVSESFFCGSFAVPD